MKIKLIVVGKLKEKYLKEGIQEYIKRISRFAKFEIIELPDEKTPDGASELQTKAILDKEGKRIIEKIQDREFVFSLAIEGEQLTSEKFSRFMEEKMIGGYSTLTFVIGGSLGLSEKVKKRSNYLLSFGRFTLPHQLMRLILIEQIYRSFTIQQGSPYHK